jgi:acid stress-induced BolA-like protein IbaG/YrbA
MTNRKEEQNNIKTDQTLFSSLNKTLKPKEWSALSIKYLSPVK